MSKDILWNNTCVNWSEFCYTWSECSLADELDGSDLPTINQWDKEKKKKVIKLWCKVKGYDSTFEKKECEKRININAERVNVILNEVLHNTMKIETKNINFK